MGRPILKSFLVIDPDTTWCDQLAQDAAFADLAPLICSRKKEARDALQDPTTRFRAIFLSAKCFWPSVVKLVKLAHEFHPSTPLFLLHAGVPPFTEKELSRLAVHGTLAKPISLAQLRAKIPGWEKLPMSAHGERKAAPANPEEDGQYVPVAIEEFLHGLPSFFDVSVKLPTGKYVKVLETKDALQPDRVLKYYESGADVLYLRRLPHTRCLEYCDFLNENLIVHPDIRPEMRLMYTASVGEEFLKFLDQGKVEESNVEPAYAYMNRLFTLVRHQPSERKELIDTYLANADAMEHAVGVSFACALMAAPLGIQSPAVFRQLGLASIFHDVGLMALDPSMAHEDTSRMTDEQKTLFHDHPMKSAEIVGNVRGVDATVVQAIQQHHERRDGSGFPRRSKGDGIQIYGEVVGICDDFVQLLAKQKRDPSFNALTEMEKHHFNGFSFPVIDAFRKTFMGEDGKKNLANVRSAKSK